MRKQACICDRCGEPATTWVRVAEHSYQGQMRCDAHDLIELDLCPACQRELRLWTEVRPDGGE